jgi:hypothetical protein
VVQLWRERQRRRLSDADRAAAGADRILHSIRHDLHQVPFTNKECTLVKVDSGATRSSAAVRSRSRLNSPMIKLNRNAAVLTRRNHAELRLTPGLR